MLHGVSQFSFIFNAYFSLREITCNKLATRRIDPLTSEEQQEQREQQAHQAHWLLSLPGPLEIGCDVPSMPLYRDTSNRWLR
jgi:hypothetical protein